METKVIMWNQQDKYKTDELEEACKLLQNGELVAFPTETVYGLGGNALDREASKKIYSAKGRPSDNPLIVHIADMEQLNNLVSYIPEKAKLLAGNFWPGPLTMIFHKSEIVPKETTGGLETVAVRVPNHEAALELIRHSGVCIAAPSANTSGRPSPTKAKHVYEDMKDRIPMIIDGGFVGIGIESTIIDLTEEVPVILRPGFITKKMLEGVIGPVSVDKAILEEGVKKNEHPKAPGMKYKHYAPKGNLVIFRGQEQAVIKEINKRIDEKPVNEVGIIATEETKDKYCKGHVICIGSRSDESSIARELYDALRKFDELQVKEIYSESFESENLGNAIMNRLLKAAGHQVYQC